MKYKVILDSGHGGNDIGASNKYVKEKDINLKQAESCKKFLSHYKEFDIVMTRHQDTNVTLNTRCYISNAEQANLFVSFHNNAGGGDGYEVYHFTNSLKGKMMAKLLSEEFDIIGQNKRYVGSGLYAGTKKGDYYVLANTDCPAILGEFGFLDTKDYQQFDEEFENIKIGQAYAKAILRYFNVELKKESYAISNGETYVTKDELETMYKKFDDELDSLYKKFDKKLRKMRKVLNEKYGIDLR